MPLQNRVTPFGEIVAVPSRGTMMGNRGIIHDPRTRQLLSKRWQHQTWVCCVLAYKDHRHPIMGKSHYTELFFLDEATAFAAGHRPCAYCRRADFRAFLQAWAEGLSISASQARAPLLDRHLHRERTTRSRIQITHRAELGVLPDGTFVRIDDRAWLVMGSRLLRWSAARYDLARRRTTRASVEVLTPYSTVAAFAHGYRPRVHPSAAAHVSIAASGTV